MIRALFFDAAGTLIEPAEPVAEVYARAAEEAGYPLDPAEVKKAFIHTFTGIGDPDWSEYPDGDEAERNWWSSVVSLTFGKLIGAPLPDGFFTPTFQRLFSHYADPAAWRVFPEVPEVLAAARESGFRIAVVSNFDRRLHGILEGHGLHFDAVITSADAQSRKPEPRIFQHALTALELREEDAFHAGDSRRADLEGAESLGIEAFLLERPANDLHDFFRQALERRGK